MKQMVLFGAASLLIFFGAAAVSVYGFGQYEHAWGRGGSLQVEAWLGLVAALVAMGSFGIGSAVLRRAHAERASFALGACCAAVFLSVCWALGDVAPFAGPYGAFVLLVLISALASLAGRRQAE